jgi:hypothetical protein
VDLRELVPIITVPWMAVRFHRREAPSSNTFV